ncbi:TASOR protein, partial [Neodrepanis coruscans]|nr:TASOR protein [Neodrepanis coruscans]
WEQREYWPFPAPFFPVFPPGFPLEPQDSRSLLERAVSVLHSSFLDSRSRHVFHYSQAFLVENQLFQRELQAFSRAKEAAGYSQEELEETFAFLLFEQEQEVPWNGSQQIPAVGLGNSCLTFQVIPIPSCSLFPGVYISRHADCLHPSPWEPGKSGYIVICKLIKGKVRVIPENYTTSYTCPSPGYDCHVAGIPEFRSSGKPSPSQAFEQSQVFL